MNIPRFSIRLESHYDEIRCVQKDLTRLVPDPSGNFVYHSDAQAAIVAATSQQAKEAMVQANLIARLMKPSHKRPLRNLR